MLILDLDDTLVDHSGAVFAASTLFGNEFADRIPAYDPATFPSVWRAAADRYIEAFLRGEIDFHEQRRMRLREIFAVPDMAADEADVVFESYKAHYEAAWRAFDDVMPFLEQHGRSGVGVLSDGSQSQQEAKLRAIGVDRYVSFVITAEGTAMSKPDARFFHHACTLASVEPSDACYIGDNLHKDAIGARDAGLRGVWLNRSGKPAPDDVEAIRSLADFRW